VLLGEFPPLPTGTHYVQTQTANLGFFVPYLSTTVKTGFPKGDEAGWATQESCGETVRHDEGGASSGGQVVWGWDAEGTCCCGSRLPAKGNEHVSFGVHLAYTSDKKL